MCESNNYAWFRFWIFIAVFVACDHWIFQKGYDTLLQSHKTDIEKELLKLSIEERKLSIAILKQELEG